MTDSPASPSDDQLSELSTPEPADAPSSTRRRRALWGALAVIAVAVGAVAVQSADDDPPRLPLALGAEGASKEAAADMSMRANVVYVAGPDLPELGGEATAYRLRGEADEATVQRIADALGLAGTPEREGTVWRVTDGQHTLEVNPGMGSSWWYGDTSATKSSVMVDDGAAREGAAGCIEPVAPDGATASDDYQCVPVTTIPTVAKDLPSEADARRIALDLLEATGLDTADAVVTIDGPYEGWYVNVEATIGGLSTGLHSSVTVGPKGAIQWASGTIAEADDLGSYPLVDTAEAIDRLNEGFGGFAGWSYGYGYAEDSVTTSEGSASVGATEPAVAPATDPAVDPGQPTTDPGCIALADDSVACQTGVDCSAPTTIVGRELSREDAASSCGGFAPYEPSEPVEVVLNDATPILMLVGATDGSNDGYLVPGYRFSGADGVVVDQMALTDGALAPVDQPDPSDVPRIEPGQIEPDGPMGTTTPGASGGGSPGYDPDGSVSSPVNDNPTPDLPPDTAVPCTVPEPGPNGEVPMIGCAESVPVDG